VREGSFPVDDLAAAEEAFTSSSVREVMPMIELDGRALGDGRPGPAAAALQEALRRAAAA
jgi:D-alanine transaminase